MAVMTAPETDDAIRNSAVTKHMLHLLKQLTIEEKVAMLSGLDFSTTVGVPRLRIPSLKLADSTSAVKGANLQNPVPTACFPNTAALAATWDRDLVKEMGKSVAAQARYKSAQIVLGPTVNIHRDPRAGRNFEAFSEDPVLTGQLAAALVSGIQSQGVAACLKHFVANESETGRKRYDSVVDTRTLREMYLAPFQWVVRETDPVAIMTAYNKVNGKYCSESPMIKDVLQKEWQYQGSIISDWYGTYSRIPSLEAGLDLEMPGPSKTRGRAIIEDIETGRINAELIDQRVLGILKLVTRTTGCHSTWEEVSGQDDLTSALARKIASESMVLLKNEHQVLPLNLSLAPKVSIIGLPSIVFCTGGGSASGTPQYFQRPYDCIKELHPKPDLVTLSPGVQMHKCIPMVSSEKTTANDGSHGVDVIYFNDDTEEPVLTESQPHAQVFMLGRLKPGLQETGFTYYMTTIITPETSGLHTIAVLATGTFELFVDGIMVLTRPEPDMIVEDFLFVPEKLEASCSVFMKAQQSVSVKLIVKSRKHLEVGEPTLHSARLGFLEEFSDGSAIEEAANLASNSDISIIFAGRNSEWESEGADLEDIKLPRSQDQLIKSVAKASPKTVVVLFGGNPFDVSEWIDDVDAVLLAHYPGQEAGSALAEVLTGIVNPSGKLPVSWPKNIESVPTIHNFPAALSEMGPRIDYRERLNVGYRCYWTSDGQSSARWDFGYGLSYTHFKFDNLKAVRKRREGQENEIVVEVTVENNGPVAGAEVIQVYVEDVEASVWRPVKELKAFEKIFLQPGEKKVVNLRMLEKYACSFWDEKSSQWVAEAGEFRIHVADRAVHIFLEESFAWTGL